MYILIIIIYTYIAQSFLSLIGKFKVAKSGMYFRES